MARLVPPHHPGAAGLCVPGYHPRPGQRPQAHKGGHGGLTGGLGLLPLTVPEVRRLLVALVWALRSSRASCWPGHDGADAIRPAPGAHITTAAKDKCGWSTKECWDYPVPRLGRPARARRR
jgi:hypothetical protein